MGTLFLYHARPLQEKGRRMKKVLAVIALLLFSCTVVHAYHYEEGKLTIFYRSVSVYAPAVAMTREGLIGVVSTITVTVQNGTGCSGRVFVETYPLTQIDMQGSARLAVMVAGTLTGIDVSKYDFFFVVKTDSPIIGGPSAGAIMTIATIAALEGWKLDDETMMTGMINPDGSIGPVGGIKEKIDAAHSVGARRFLIPKGQKFVYELQTKTINVGGIIEIVQKPVYINVVEYAREKYGMEVIEVENINDALLYFTGHTFEVPSTNESIITENYSATMKPLAASLLKEASENYNESAEMFNLSKYHIPNTFFHPYRNQISNALFNAKSSLEKAKEAYMSNLFYSSTSKAFQSLIYSRFVKYAVEYFTSQSGDQYIADLMSSTEDFVSKKSTEAKIATVKGLISLQSVGAAQKRAFEAEDYLEKGRENYRKGDILEALYYLAFTVERSRSVEWWLNLSKAFEEKGKVNNSVLKDVAERYLNLAIQANTYSQIILQEAQKSSSLLEDAQSLLEDAREEIDNYPAASLFSSLESLTKANLALELISGASKDKLDRARNRSAVAISDSRKAGIEPFMAVSYFEYAENLKKESIKDAIVYYKYAQMIAGALQFMVSPPSRKQSRFVGVPPHAPISGGRSILVDVNLLITVLGATMILLVIAVLIILRERRFRRDFPPELWIPKSVREYYRKR